MIRVLTPAPLVCEGALADAAVLEPAGGASSARRALEILDVTKTDGAQGFVVRWAMHGEEQPVCSFSALPKALPRTMMTATMMMALIARRPLALMLSLSRLLTNRTRIN